MYMYNMTPLSFHQTVNLKLRQNVGYKYLVFYNVYKSLGSIALKLRSTQIL